MSAVLLIRLAGPMQSWGTQSRFGNRDTDLEPSKSGVIGLLCAALGRPRDHDVSDLAALVMAVRVDCEGRVGRDFHTAQNVLRSDRSGVAETVLSDRFFLADASFLVGLAGPRPFLELLDKALREPTWALSLGRKSFVPGVPPAAGVFDRELLDVLSAQPRYSGHRAVAESEDPPLRYVVETAFGQGTDVRRDVPLSFAPRRFTIRHVETRWIKTQTQPPESGQ